jgi:hypothetical protein
MKAYEPFLLLNCIFNVTFGSLFFTLTALLETKQTEPKIQIRKFQFAIPVLRFLGGIHWTIMRLINTETTSTSQYLR